MMKVLIADDEPLARERIRELLAGRADVAIAGEARDGEEALRLVLELAPDLLFLDVQMPALDGFEMLAQLDAPPPTIFVTAYDEYAVRAFEVNALDYLVKPFNRARFDAAFERARSRAPEQFRAAVDGLPKPRLTRFVVRTPEQIYFVKPADVRWLDSAGNYVRLHTANGEHLVRGSIREMEERLDPDVFVRVHRSTIVQLDAIEKLEPWFHGEFVITLVDGTRITSSRSYSSRLRDLLK
ncbi:MAG TPA: LytTR family DNA-binding domain-containing protein [Thermoanaerobaculia bacterium]|jgi:two-component system LytT family response regulator